MEVRDLYDINGNLTGETILKGDAIPDGKYIAVVLCFIQNSKGDFLIQKRSPQKNGKYGSTSGHLMSGESSMQGMIREIKEEVGLSIKPSELKLLLSGRMEQKHYLFDIYYLKKDFNINDLILQKDEVDFVEWDSFEEIQELVNKNLFSPSHSEIFLKLEASLTPK